MSLIGKKVSPFKVQAYQTGRFIEVTEADLQGQWSVFLFYPANFTFV
jgi:peroxiredoxin (alkyl hydroperoxide reductase subunit C)